jgi:hypothetical protein
MSTRTLPAGTERKADAFDLVVAAALSEDTTPEEVGRRTRQIVWSYLHAVEELEGGA